MKKSFPLRIDERLLEALRRWADDDFRSLNGQIEYLLREALRDHHRLKPNSAKDETENSSRAER